MRAFSLQEMMGTGSFARDWSDTHLSGLRSPPGPGSIRKGKVLRIRSRRPGWPRGCRAAQSLRNCVTNSTFRARSSLSYASAAV